MTGRRLSMNVRVGAVLAAVMMFLAIAYSSVAAAAETANTLKVSPIRSDIRINPGQSKVVDITVTNLTGDAISIHPGQNDFIAGDEDGSPALILDEDQYAPTHSLKRFMAPLSDFTIPAEQAKTIKVRINVPKDAQAGGYFGAVRFAPTSPDEGGQVNLAPSVASLILLTVPGDLVEELSLTEFTIQQDERTSSLFFDPAAINASVRFENKGNVQVPPFGRVSVLKGEEVVYETDFNANDPQDMVLPDSARRWQIPLEDIGEFGHYTVAATFTYGAENKTVEVEKSFWVIPLWAIIAALGAIVALITAIVFIVLRKRRHPKIGFDRSSRRR